MTLQLFNILGWDAKTVSYFGSMAFNYTEYITGNRKCTDMHISIKTHWGKNWKLKLYSIKWFYYAMLIGRAK